ncbi:MULTISPECIES: hypothetical protein [Sphingomonas]|uniref:Uncharacterized protein n=1 Tax=Sphingomonas carotinifaciens TaxID=1166323 RepID=A0A1G7NFH2_9SPHN|nr:MULTISPECIES: hypothetical protein [Sphingomonas]MBB4087097.1 hypothetical protein [Sphingomonas carotinifaciens]MDY0957799.1 hypothetical protein [Sphingomonas sp. CFBP8993]MWC43216.1 hypothetical protein [Sphingomonas carotinifaciens]SDF72794.1 hypothetical protein SAMN05216557_105148 [Sphingomonas carotinifaciens]
MRFKALLMTMACLATAATSIAATVKRNGPLQATTMRDWRAAGMDGTGCYWSARRNGPVLFAANGRTGMTRVAGRVVVLEPAAGARELFPFTHDAWQAPGLKVRILDAAVVRAMGYETVTTDATLVVKYRSTTVRLRGSMICGS